MNLKYLVSSDKELKELKESMNLFQKNYSLEPKGLPVNVAKMRGEKNHVYIASPIEPPFGLKGVFPLNGLRSKTLPAVIRPQNSLLDITIGDWKYSISIHSESLLE